MLVTACASSFTAKLKPAKGSPTLALVDLPAYIRNELGLHGMELTTTLLKGCDRALLTKIVENADKVGCPCLSLIEPEPQPLYDEKKAEQAEDRVKRVVQAAQWLSCRSAAIRVAAPDDDDAMLEVAERLRPIIRRAEKMEINICIGSAPGLTEKPDRVAELLKKIGGFRVGTLPDFASAAASGDAAGYLRRLVPYASTVLATLKDLTDADSVQSAAGTSAAKPKSRKKSKDSAETAIQEPPHKTKPLGLADCVNIVDAVGFDGSLALEYRGAKDPIAVLLKAKEIINTLIGTAAVALPPAAGGAAALLEALAGVDDAGPVPDVEDKDPDEEVADEKT